MRTSLLCLGAGILVGAGFAASAQASADGEAVYKQFCAQCHGLDLRGGNAQSMVDGVWQFGDGGWIASNIKFGIADLGMPAYESTLTKERIDAVVEFIRTAEKSSGAVKPAPSSKVETRDYHVKVTPWLSGLDEPWGIAFPDTETVLLTEKVGRLRVVKNGALDPAPVSGTPEVVAEGQGGLMDVAVDPQYAKNGWVYLAFTHGLAAVDAQSRRPAMTKIVRGKVIDGAWTDEQTLFEAPHETYSSTRVHFGCRIVFDKDGHLFFSIGDRGAQAQAQDITRPNGKIHRIRADGRVLRDNPFARKSGAARSIYSFGNRNPQGLAIHPETGLLWETEHGPMDGDEINVIRRGLNYGWPVVTWGRNYNGAPVSDLTAKEGIEPPTAFWRPSIAVCGIDFYTGGQFPKWKNALLVTALKYEELRVVHVYNDRVLNQEVVLKNVGRVRDVGCGLDGAIYVVTNDPGAVLKLAFEKERDYGAAP